MSLTTLIAQMRDLGIEPPDMDKMSVDGQLHRFGKKKNGWFALHWFALDNGDQVLTGRFGDWKLGIDAKVSLDMPPLSDAERRRFAAGQKEQALLAQQVKQDKQREAASRALTIWEKLPTDGYSPYLRRKKVVAFGIRFSRDSVVIPVYKADGMLSGLQFIDAEGNKKFLTGSAVEGAFHTIGTIKPDGFVMLAEGYATGASLYMAMGQQVPCVIAFNANNLEPVALVLRDTYPDIKIVLCADNDDQTAGNPGLTKAVAAAKACNGKVVVPQQSKATPGVTA
jgi:putative DNA primase/helicase